MIKCDLESEYSNKSESFQADNFDHFLRGVKATVCRVKCRLATLVALLIELKAQIL